MDEIVPRAHGFALFAATLGQELDDDVREMFAHGDPAQGFMLDMVASSAADRLAHLMADAFMAALAASGRASDGWHALPYSPGYCGWHVSGQRALFDRLEPAAAGIALTSSCLMQPIKSVSGVVIVGPAQAHRFRPNYPFCDVCATRECLPRMASTKGKRK
jgi:cobalamin-dependent methionine synthase I